MSYILKPQSFYFHIYLMFSSFQTMESQIEANQARIGSIEERPKKTFQPTSPLTTTQTPFSPPSQPTSPVITHRRCHFCPSQLFALLHSSRLSISTRISGSPIGTCLQNSAGYYDLAVFSAVKYITLGQSERNGLDFGWFSGPKITTKKLLLDLQMHLLSSAPHKMSKTCTNWTFCRHNLL